MSPPTTVSGCAPAAKAKDLPAKKNAKGGIRQTGGTDTNHNETL